MSAVRYIWLLALLLTVCGSAALAQTTTHWQEQQWQAMHKADAVMQRATAYPGLLAQYRIMRHAYAADHDPAFRLIFSQYLSWQLSFLGDYTAAEKVFSVPQRAMADDAPPPLGGSGYRPVPAIVCVPKLAAKHRVVFLNEAHNIALTRSLTVRLLRALRKEGFNIFAAETLRQSDIVRLQQRGYPTETSGFYTREPIYAEMVRTALKLGYRVVAYEADSDLNGDAREAQQAQHLWDILKHDPYARMVVNAGYEHTLKTGKFLGATTMAEHFMQDSGITPLSVEQTILIPHPDRSMNHPDYDAIIAAVHPTQPIVFVNPDGKPWALRAGYDVSVIFPAEHLRLGRPTWLGLWGLRVPFPIDASICRDRFPCVVRARYADEGDDAVPADRMVLDPAPETTIGDTEIFRDNASLPAGELYLRPDDYVLTATDENGHILGHRSIEVAASEHHPP